MSRLLVPIALDALVVRSPGGAWAETKMNVPEDVPAGAPDQRQQLLPAPFRDLASPRAAGVHLHWALADALTALQPATERFPPRFRPVPSRWLIMRMSGPASPKRQLAAWLLPNVHDKSTQVVSDILTRPDSIPVGAAPLPLTTAGYGELGWSAYYDNVSDRLGFHDPLAGVVGPVAYLVCGWYTHTSFDPLTPADGEALTEATFRANLDALGWYADGPVPATIPTQSLYHGSAVGIAWPGTTWTGDGNGKLSAEIGGPPAPGEVDVALAETIAAALARLTTEGIDADELTRLVEGLAQHVLRDLGEPDGDQRLMASLHATRFGDVPQPRRLQTIYRPPEVLADPPAGARDGATPRRGGAAIAGDIHDALAAAAPETRDAPSVADTRGDSTEEVGELTSVSRTQPRLFHPVDPTLAVEGLRRSYRHGGDGRFDSRAKLRCRYSGQHVTGLGAPGETPPHGADVVPDWLAVDVPAEVHALLDETATLDPASAPGLTDAPSPSPHAAARAAWWTTWDRSAPGGPLPSPLPYAITGVEPSPVAVTPPSRPWTPLHLEWEVEWRASPRGARDWQLGELDYELPSGAQIPPDGRTLRGRAVLTPAPASLLASGAERLAEGLDSAGADQGLVDELHSAAAGGGARGALRDADLLAGSMYGFLDRVRGVPEGEIVEGDPEAPQSPYPVTPLRAGFLSLRRLRAVDTYGQQLYLLGSSATAPIDSARLKLHADLAVPGRPELAAQVPRFTAAARVLLRYTDRVRGELEVAAGQSPVCGFLVPSPFDATLEFFDHEGANLGRLRPEAVAGTAWEEAPGQSATLGRLPSQIVADAALGAIGDGLLAFDTAVPAGTAGRTALASLLRIIDTTQWTVDQTGKAGDEHLALLLGNPVAVLRARLLLEVDEDFGRADAERTAIAVRLGSLGHLDDGLLGYYVGNDFSRVHVVDPAVAELAPPLPIDGATAAEALMSDYIDDSGIVWVQPGQPVPLTLLVAPGADVRVTTGLLPQKAVGMRREWIERGLSHLTPTLRYGPILRDPKTTRIPVPTDIHGTWTWHRRVDAATWANDSVVPATPDALLPESPPAVDEGWLRVTLIPEVEFRDNAVPIQVTCIDKPADRVAIRALGGTNRDGSAWRLPIDQAVQMVESGRFRFFVDVAGRQADLEVGVASSGRKFLRTTADTTTVNNLLSLPRCTTS